MKVGTVNANGSKFTVSGGVSVDGVNAGGYNEFMSIVVTVTFGSLYDPIDC